MLRFLILILFCLSTPAGMAAWSDPPEVFDKRPYAEAKKAAEDGKRWLIVKGTAEWCAPCKRMDKTTWVDAKVVEWMKKNGVAVALDVDKEPKIAEELKIQAMPTMIAMKEGKEFDRVTGYRSAADLLVWLEGIAKGEKSIEAIRKQTAPKEDGRQDIRARMQMAKHLAATNQADEAAAEYVWLWENMLDHAPSMYGVRLSFMVADMGELASASKAARTRFTELRDEAGKAVEREKVAMDDLVDWVALNRVLNDGATTLKWYDRVKGEPRWRPLVERVSRDLEDLFILSRRWADLGKLYAEPLEKLERDYQVLRLAPETPLPEGLDEATREYVRDIPARLFREDTSRLYAGLLAGGRDAEAAKFAARARELYTKPELVQAMINGALEAGQARQEHVEWIDTATLKTPALKELKPKVLAALKKTEGK